MGCWHTCCWHLYTGAIFMVIPDGHVVQECCACRKRRTIRRDHAVTKSHALGSRY